LRGFRSYADKTTFRWDGRGLVGIVGPIGSGKSSILDAIAFALYGRTPRIERDTKSLINQRRDALQLEMTFDVDGETYKAVRSLRRGGASAHVLYRIEDDAEVELTDRAREMTEQVETLLGLDFDAFRRSVLLAQNRFADFLEATGTERNQVLKGVFGFDRLDAMRAVAKERLDALGGRLTVLADRRVTAEADRAELEAKRSELKTVEERAAALELLRAPFDDVKEHIAAAVARSEEEKERLDRLDRLADRIPAREQTELLFEDAGSAQAGLAAAQDELTVAGTEREAAAIRVTDAYAPVGDKADLMAVGDLVAAWKAARDRAAEADKAVTEATGQVERERAGAAAVSGRLQTAERAEEAVFSDERVATEVFETAGLAVRSAYQAHRAHALRADLVVGESCPVCEQAVATVPDRSAPASVEQAEQAVVATRETLEVASAAARSASEAVARLRAEVGGAEQAQVAALAAAEAVERRRDEVTQGLAAAGKGVEERLGSGDPEAALEEIRSGAAAAESALERATSTEDAARKRRDEARAAAADTQAALGALRADLATLAGLLESEIEVGEESVALEEAFGGLRTP